MVEIVEDPWVEVIIVEEVKAYLHLAYGSRSLEQDAKRIPIEVEMMEVDNYLLCRSKSTPSASSSLPELA